MELVWLTLIGLIFVAFGISVRSGWYKTVGIEISPVESWVEDLWFETFDARAPWEVPLNLRLLAGAAP